MAKWERKDFQRVDDKEALRGARGQLGPEGEASVGGVSTHGHIGLCQVTVLGHIVTRLRTESQEAGGVWGPEIPSISRVPTQPKGAKRSLL